jgi:hypothetical protein
MMPEPQMPVTPTACRVLEARFVRPQIAPITGSAAPAFGIDAHALDGAGRRALAGGDLRALEGRAGRRGAGDRSALRLPSTISALVPTSTSSIISSPVRAFGQRRAGGVGADMAGDAGQHIDPRAGIDGLMSISAGPNRERAGDGQREGRLAEFGRVDAEEQVVHDRIADEDQARECRARRRRLGAPCRSGR